MRKFFTSKIIRSTGATVGADLGGRPFSPKCMSQKQGGAHGGPPLQSLDPIFEAMR